MFDDPVLVQSAAARYALPPALVAAIIDVESSGDTWAWNPEPKYRWFWDVRRSRPFRAVTDAEVGAEFPPSDFPTLAGDRDQEWWGQQASWGLMQVMGAVARERGCREPYLTQLCDPALNLDIGCWLLATLRRRFHDEYGWDGVIAAYNAGSPRRHDDGSFVNQSYVDKVRARWAGQ